MYEALVLVQRARSLQRVVLGSTEAITAATGRDPDAIAELPLPLPPAANQGYHPLTGRPWTAPQLFGEVSSTELVNDSLFHDAALRGSQPWHAQPPGWSQQPAMRMGATPPWMQAAPTAGSPLHASQPAAAADVNLHPGFYSQRPPPQPAASVHGPLTTDAGAAAAREPRLLSGIYSERRPSVPPARTAHPIDGSAPGETAAKPQRNRNETETASTAADGSAPGETATTTAAPATAAVAASSPAADGDAKGGDADGIAGGTRAVARVTRETLLNMGPADVLGAMRNPDYQVRARLKGRGRMER